MLGILKMVQEVRLAGSHRHLLWKIEGVTVTWLTLLSRKTALVLLMIAPLNAFSLRLTINVSPLLIAKMDVLS